MLTQLLLYLPKILIVWTSVLLCWGIYCGVCYSSIISWAKKCTGRIRNGDIPHVILIGCVDILLVMYLWSSSIYSFIGDTMLVLNIFYTAILIETTCEIIRWQGFKLRFTQSLDK